MAGRLRRCGERASEACPDAVYDVAIDATGIATFGSDKSFDLELTAAPSITIKIITATRK